MPRNNTNWTAIIGFVTLIILILYYSGYFKEADIHPIRQTATSSCPDNVYSAFQVNFENTGETGSALFVEVWSENLNFTKSSDSVYLPQRPTSLTFEINTNSYPRISNKEYNFTIHYSYTYKGNEFRKDKTLEIFCRYVREPNNNYLKLIE